MELKKNVPLTVQEFLSLKANDYFLNNTAKQAYNDFIREGNSSSYPYFRTQYNNFLKNNIEKPIKISKTFNAEITEEFLKATRKKINYKKGDIIPEVPKLIPTGTIFDKLISDRFTTDKEIEDYKNRTGEDMPSEDIEIGGFTRKCSDIRAGGPGAGKTTLTTMMAAKAKIFSRREYNKEISVGFISGEMRDTEWAKELATYEILKELEVDYMLDYVGYPNYEDIFWEAVGDYDIVIIDSLPAILSHFKMSWDTSKGKMPSENQMIFDFIRKLLKSVEQNNNNVQVINQANKDGNYKGGTELPHMLSSMSFVVVDGQERYIEFEKNRNNGKVKRKLYFKKTNKGDITFDEEVYKSTYEQIEDKKQNLTEFMEELNERGKSILISGEFEKNQVNENKQVDLLDSIEEIENESINN